MKIRRDIFQVDVPSSLQYVIAMMPLNYKLRKCARGYEFKKITRLIAICVTLYRWPAKQTIPFFPFSLLAGTLWHFFLLLTFVCQLDSLVRLFPIFFSSGFFHPGLGAIVTLPPSPHTHSSSSNHPLLGRPVIN